MPHVGVYMVIRKSLKFITSDSPIGDAITKFGGQPNWLDTPQWPISSELNSPMRFICQIKLTDELFPGCSGKMAYIFMSDSEEYVDGTWEPDGGENAIIVQPNGESSVEIRNINTGPTLQAYIDVIGKDRRQPIDIELSVELSHSEDPEFIPEAKRYKLADEEVETYSSSLEGSKIGGTPGFMQGDEYPGERENWMFLMQLDSCDVPFFVNFGDAGIAYAFINTEGTIGKFLWQCA